MQELVVIALGGAVGALARFGVSHISNVWFGSHFPYGTLICNIMGSFLIGIAFVILTEKALLSPVWRSAIIIGFLGAFTTFSTFSIQSLALFEEGRLAAALLYILASVVICILATSAGMVLGRQLP
jgi:fluoride exporter